jgi:hypothetical protein
MVDENRIKVLDDIFVWAMICDEIGRKFDSMMLAYEKNPSSILLDEIKCKNEALIFLLEYTAKMDSHIGWNLVQKFK